MAEANTFWRGTGLATIAALLLTFAYQLLLYSSGHGWFSGSDNPLLLFVMFPVIVLFAAVLLFLAALVVALAVRAFGVARLLSLAAALSLAASIIVPWSHLIDLARIGLNRSDLSAGFAKVRDTYRIPPQEPVAILWGEAGFAGMNEFHYLVHDPAGKFRGNAREKVFLLFSGWTDATLVDLLMGSCVTDSATQPFGFVVLRVDVPNDACKG